jgi:hypothetical protein
MTAKRSRPVPEVSVIIPLYGEHVGNSRLPLVVRAWLDQRVPPAVVVVTAGEPRLDRGVTGLPGVRVVVAPPTATAPGLLRNVGAASVTTPWLYLADADVAPLGGDYLTRVLDLAGGGAFVQPAMLWLVGPLPRRPVAGWQLRDEPAGDERICFVTADARGALVRLPGERTMWENGAPMVLPPVGYEDARDAPEIDWRPMFHWGSVLLRRELFDAVGGYCTAYRGWGCEDDDLLVKLDGTTRVRHGWREEPGLRCVHFEHPRPYGDQFRANRELLRQRRRQGLAAMIAADLASRG